MNNDWLINQILKKGGGNSEQIKNAVKSGDAQQLMSSLSEEDSKKLQGILSDKQATEKLLSSPEAQSLYKILFGDGKKNG